MRPLVKEWMVALRLLPTWRKKCQVWKPMRVLWARGISQSVDARGVPSLRKLGQHAQILRSEAPTSR